MLAYFIGFWESFPTYTLMKVPVEHLLAWAMTNFT